MINFDIESGLSEKCKICPSMLDIPIKIPPFTCERQSCNCMGCDDNNGEVCRKCKVFHLP